MWDGNVLAPAGAPRLTLITCYPFDALLGGPERYVVTCEPADHASPASRTDGPSRASDTRRHQHQPRVAEFRPRRHP